jgi:hypothetical protein
MARQVITYSPGHDLRRQLVACDPAGLKTLSVPIQRNQGVLEPGTFIDIDGQRAVIASQVEGVLAAVVDSDFPDPPDSLSGRIAVYTSGRFLWSQVRTANPSFVFDQYLESQEHHVRGGRHRFWQPVDPRASAR